MRTRRRFYCVYKLITSDNCTIRNRNYLYYQEEDGVGMHGSEGDLSVKQTPHEHAQGIHVKLGRDGLVPQEFRRLETGSAHKHLITGVLVAIPLTL